MSKLPDGELQKEIESPNGELSIKIYLHSPSLSADAIRGELNFERKKRKPKNIYWSYMESDAEVVWINEYTVNINGKTLDVFNDTYDWRQDKKRPF